ncbi:MAG TPA: hypothetical protein VIG47_04790, partial [Gemmatimonadaceae bacterium]
MIFVAALVTLLSTPVPSHAPTRQAAPAITYNGRERQLRVAPPRLDGDVTIDGKLDEPQWQQAARLAGFSQFAPSDGVPA